jgi:hypothetical protein
MEAEKIVTRSFRLDPDTDRLLTSLVRRCGGNLSQVLRTLIRAEAVRSGGNHAG